MGFREALAAEVKWAWWASSSEPLQKIIEAGVPPGGHPGVFSVSVPGTLFERPCSTVRVPCPDLQTGLLRTREAHGTQKPKQLCCAQSGLCVNFIPSQASAVWPWVLVRARQTPPRPCLFMGLFLLQPQGKEFCPSILALSSVLGSGTVRRVRPAIATHQLVCSNSHVVLPISGLPGDVI